MWPGLLAGCVWVCTVAKKRGKLKCSVYCSDTSQEGAASPRVTRTDRQDQKRRGSDRHACMHAFLVVQPAMCHLIPEVLQEMGSAGTQVNK